MSLRCGDQVPAVGMLGGMALVICVMTGSLRGICVILMAVSLVVPLSSWRTLLAGGALGAGAFLVAPQWAPVTPGDHVVSGIVSSVSYVRGAQQIILRQARVDGDPVRGRVRLKRYTAATPLGAGQSVYGPARFNDARGLGNAGESSWRWGLLARGITATGTLRSGGRDGDGGALPRPLEKTRAVLSTFARPEAEVLNAMVCGERGYLLPPTRDACAALGVAHILAISGLHIALIMLFGQMLSFQLLRIGTPLCWYRDAPLVARVCGILAACIYVWGAGMSVPTVRALIMGAVIAAALTGARRVHPLSAWALAGIIILLLRPWALFTVSFQLSFSAVFGILSVLERHGKAGWAWKGVLVTWTATVFTSPLAMWHFGFVSPWAVVANLVVIPLMGLIIMPCALVGVFLTELGITGAWCWFPVLDLVGLLLSAGQHWGSLVPVARPWFVWMLACYGLLLMAFWGRWRMGRLIWPGFLLLFFLPVVQAVYVNTRGLTFETISVGQGDAHIVSRGTFAMLIDAGPGGQGFDAGRWVVMPHLLRRGITSLDVLIVTHVHPDHAGGVPAVLAHLPVDEVWVGRPTLRHVDFKSVTEIARRRSVYCRQVQAGDVFNRNGLIIEVLNPLPGHGETALKLDHNLHSVVVRIGDSTMRGLFMADADHLGELILANGRANIAAEVLKVAHHGSRNSCLPVFLDAVGPRIALIACGRGNRYGVPAPETLARLYERGIAAWRTDVHGSVRVRNKDGRMLVKWGRNMPIRQAKPDGEVGCPRVMSPGTPSLIRDVSREARH